MTNERRTELAEHLYGMGMTEKEMNTHLGGFEGFERNMRKKNPAYQFDLGDYNKYMKMFIEICKAGKEHLLR